MTTAKVRQGERHFACDVDISPENLRRLKYFYKLLDEWMEANSEKTPVQACYMAECRVYQCLLLLKSLGAWKAVSQSNCKLLNNQCPSGPSYPNREEVNLFLTLGGGDQEYFKEIVNAHVLSMLWYLNTRLLGRKIRQAEWMDRKYAEPERRSLHGGIVCCFLLQNSISAKRLMFRCFDNTLEDGELKHIVDIFPEAVWQANNDGELETFIYTSDDSLDRKLKSAECHVLVIIPVVPPGNGRPWRVKFKKEVIEELSKLKFIENWKRLCRLVFIFEDSSLMKTCQNTMKLIAEKLSVNYISHASDQKESLSSRLAKVEDDWKYGENTDILLTMTRRQRIIKRTASKEECSRDILDMVSDILSPPAILTASDLGNRPVPVTDAIPDFNKNEYVNRLKDYFNLEKMHEALTEVLKVNERPYPKWEEQLKNGRALYEPPHPDSKNGYTWHEAHNAATFLILLTYMIRYLMRQIDEVIDVERFNKDVRSLTAKLDFRQKDKINANKLHSRGKYAPKDRDTLVRNAVKRLLSSAWGM